MFMYIVYCLDTHYNTILVLHIRRLHIISSPEVLWKYCYLCVQGIGPLMVTIISLLTLTGISFRARTDTAPGRG